MRSTWQRAAAGLLVFSFSAFAASSPVELAKFTGVFTCQSSGCHGGGLGSDQCAVWATADHHKQAYVILEAFRSVDIVNRMNENDGIKAPGPANPEENPRCTVCHNPFEDLHVTAPERMLPTVDLTGTLAGYLNRYFGGGVSGNGVGSSTGDNGVSCESCHGPASTWLRSHTRKDYTYEQRLACGMTDLRSAYGRANTCVACHEHLPLDIAATTHPELIFELDSQAVSEPPHWQETDPWIGLHSWLAGQAVAFREDVWNVLELKNGTASEAESDAQHDAAARWEALGWLLQETASNLKDLPAFSIPQDPLTASELTALKTDSDKLAKSASDYAWSTDDAQHLLRSLASSGAGVTQGKDVISQVHRAEVLVQALDRLLVELHAHNVDFPGSPEKLDTLFADVRVASRVETAFNTPNFVQDLSKFSGSLGNR